FSARQRPKKLNSKPLAFISVRNGPTVDVDGLTSYAPTVFRGQEQRQRSDLFRSDETILRTHFLQSYACFFLRDAGSVCDVFASARRHVGVDVAGTDCIDCDSVPRYFERG